MAAGAALEPPICLSTNKQLSDLLQALCELRERGSFCDVVVEVQSCRYLAHKAVLSSTSGYFRSLFLGAPCSSMGPFVVDCVSAGAFELALDFVYKGTVTVGGPADVRELHRGARRLGIVGLEEACAPFLPPPSPAATPPAANAGELNVVEVARAGAAFGFEYGDGCYDGGAVGEGDGGEGPRSPALRAKLSPAPRFGPVSARDVHGGAFEEWPLARETPASRARPRGGVTDRPDGAFGELVPIAAAGDYKMKVESPDERFYGGAGGAVVGPRGSPRLPDRTLDDRKPVLSFLRMASPSQSRFHDDDDDEEVEEEEEEETETAEAEACALARCLACGEAVEESVSALREHSCGHLDMERLACRLCAARFANISDAVEHALAHTGAALLACRYCGHKFLSPDKLSAHARGHCKKRKYKGVGTRLSNVRQLKWQRQAVPAERATCGACGAAVAGCMSDLRDHGLVHLDVENQRCRLCGYVSLYKSNLVKHSLVHIGVYLYSCGACRKSFLFKYEMDRHVCLKAKMEVIT